MGNLDWLSSLAMHGTGDSDRHAVTLFAIAVASRGKRILELGVRSGGTTLPLLRAAAANGGLLTSVDIRETDFVCPDELRRHWRFIRSDTVEYLKSCQNGKAFDLVFIDDWHAYPHVKQELQLLEKLTTPSSVILLHDLMYGGAEPRYHTNAGQWKGEWAFGGPYRAVSNLPRRKWEWATLPWGHGLTILRKKAPLWSESRIKMWSKRLLRALSPAKARLIQNRYRNLVGHE